MARGEISAGRLKSYCRNSRPRPFSGKLFFTIVAAFAQFEREIIRERVIAGLENARSKGKVLGRPRLGDSLIEKAKELRKQGMSYRQIGRELETPESTIRKRLSSVR
jgi:putative DNA-invertase from lambdoid prophage Rac